MKFKSGDRVIVAKTQPKVRSSYGSMESVSTGAKGTVLHTYMGTCLISLDKPIGFYVNDPCTGLSPKFKTHFKSVPEEDLHFA